MFCNYIIARVTPEPDVFCRTPDDKLQSKIY